MKKNYQDWKNPPSPLMTFFYEYLVTNQDKFRSINLLFSAQAMLLMTMTAIVADDGCSKPTHRHASICLSPTQDD